MQVLCSLVIIPRRSFRSFPFLGKKPKNAKGFLAFIPWPFQDDGTLLKRVRGISNNVHADEYIRMIALSRIMLPNVKNIQASWLTVGKAVGQMCLHAGANDFGSIMIEEKGCLYIFLILYS